ncbi:hypothetical protein [Ideonella sp.]|uniref:hypothetical protein n=1 Tax=Ideonella sp. TaxID=1929293 RepID=UPI0035B30E86
MTHRLPCPPRAIAVAAAALVACSATLAAPASSSAYRTDAQQSHVEDATSRGISQVNMITCVMGAMRPEALVNQGNYIALVDGNKCDPEARASSSNSGADSASTSAPAYMTSTVNSARGSNDEPMRVKTWIDEKEKDFAATIFVNISATEAPSDSNPYGIFRLDYCGKGGDGPCMMNGYLDGNAEGISYFEIEGGGDHSSTKALRLTSSGADGGAGRLSYQQGDGTVNYRFAYNADYFRRSDGASDQCFSRDASDADTQMSVWRYGLYDAASGARIERHSGFPIEFTAGDGQRYSGHMGYWGLWLPADAPALANGATVQRVEYQDGHDPVKTDYTLAKAGGRLMRYTKQTRTLADIDKLPFQTWVWQMDGFFEGAQPNRQYEMHWDNTAGEFRVSGEVVCDNGPCQSRTYEVEKSVPASYFGTIGGMRGWSQSLGGELYIPIATGGAPVDAAHLNVVYRQQDLVYPADMPAELHCLRECPTAETIAAYFTNGSVAESPFVPATYNRWGPAEATVDYSTSAADALLKDGAGQAVTATNAEALASNPRYQNGLRSGRLFASLDDARCTGDSTHFCEEKIEQLDAYYQWETGPNQWNQFAALKNSQGAFVNFDAPLQVNYTVPAGAAYGDYAGKTLVLQYGGFGELWGIPGECVSRLTNAKVSCDTPDSRYVPAFVIPFDETLGRVSVDGTTYLVKWLDREIRFARKEISVCQTAGLALPDGLALPTADDLRNPSDPASPVYIGAKPEVTAAPRVIHGEVKY